MFYPEILHQYDPSIVFDQLDDSGTYESIEVVPPGIMPTKEVLDTFYRNTQIKFMWESIKTERDRRKEAGVKVGNYFFHSDSGSRIQQLGLVMMGANIPPNLMWKTMDGVFVQMTPTLALQIFSSVANYDIGVFTAAETHKAMMSASPNPGEYDFSQGWPVTFGE